MTVATTEPQATAESTPKSGGTSTAVRVARYTGLRLVTLFGTVVVGVYLTIMIANMGGYVDQIMKNDIRERITQQFAANRAMQNVDPQTRQRLIQQSIALEENRMGLNTPVAVRNARYLVNALTLNLGRAINMTSDSGS